MYKIGGKILQGGIFILLLLCLSLPGLPALAAGGISVAPASKTLDQVLRGSECQASVRIRNNATVPVDYKIAAEGDSADWMSFTYQEQLVDRVTVPPSTVGTVIVNIAVPDDAASGTYVTDIVVTSVPSGVAGSGQAVSLSASSELIINVVGEQVISGRVSSISAEDTEIGYPLIFRVHFENTGNVAVAPVVNADITLNGKTVDTFSSSDTLARANTNDYINVKWDTTGQVPEKYVAHLSVLLEGDQIYTQDVSFQLLPFGSLDRSGELREIRALGTSQTGAIIKIEAVFVNTGNTDVLAKLVGEVYLNDDLVQTLDGEEVIIHKGMEDSTSAYFTPKEAGLYTIKGQVNFGGTKTEVKEITLDVKAPQTTTSNPATSGTVSQISETGAPPTVPTEPDSGTGFSLSQLPWLYIGGGLGVVLIIIIILFLNSKR